MPCRYKLSVPIFLFVIATVFSGVAVAQEGPGEKIVRVTGRAAVSGKNIQKSREKAISEGLATAVDQAALEIIPIKAFAADFRKLNKILHDRTDKFVRNYKIMAEAQIGKMYRVLLEVTVLTNELQARKGKLPEPVRAAASSSPRPAFPTDSRPASAAPGILFLIAEQDLENESPQYWWGEGTAFLDSFSETAMAGKMREKGFHVVSHGYMPSSEGAATNPVALQPDLSNREAVKIGLRMQADVVIVGKSLVYRVSGRDGNTESFNGTVSARAIRTDTGEEISSTLQTTVKKDRNEAGGSRKVLSAAGSLAGEDLARQIADMGHEKTEPVTSGLLKSDRPALPSEQSPTRLSTSPIHILVSGTSDLGNFVKFRRTLNEMTGVSEIRIMEMKADKATILVNFQGNAENLADKLMGKTFKLFYLKLYDTTQNTLSIELVSK